jgi:diguanylate cyclase (GGDEF)-like protein
LAEAADQHNFQRDRRPRSDLTPFDSPRVNLDLRRSAAGGGKDSYRDPLTRLADLPVFERRLSQAVQRTEPMVAILFADIDPLPTVDDTHGHRLGNQLLGAVAGRLTRLIGPDDTLICVAGNKVAVLCEGLCDLSAVEALVARIDVALNGEYALTPTNVSVVSTVSVLFAGAAEHIPKQILRHTETVICQATCNLTPLPGSASPS